MKKSFKRFTALILTGMLVASAFPLEWMAKVSAMVTNPGLAYSGHWPSEVGDKCVSINDSAEFIHGAAKYVVYYTNYYDSGEKKSYNKGDTLKAGKNDLACWVYPNSGYEFGDSLDLTVRGTKDTKYTSYHAVFQTELGDARIYTIETEIASPEDGPLTVNYSGGTVSYEAGKKVPVCLKDSSNNITNYTMSNSSLFTFDGVTWVNRTKNLNYIDGDKFTAGDKVRIIVNLIRKDSTYEFPDELSIDFIGEEFDFEYLNATGNTAKYSIDITIPGGAEPTNTTAPNPTNTTAPNPTNTTAPKPTSVNNPTATPAAKPTNTTAPKATATPAPTTAADPTAAANPTEAPASSALPAEAASAETVGHEGYMKYPKYSETQTFFKFTLTGKSDIEISQGVSDKDAYNLYNEKGEVIASFSEKDLNEKRRKRIEGLDAGTYYLGIRGTSPNNAGSFVGGDQLFIYTVADNKTAAGAQKVDLSDSENTVTFEWQQTGVNGRDKMYYKLNVPAKTYYDFTGSAKGVSGYLYKGDAEKGDSLFTAAELSDNRNGEYLLDAGTYLLAVVGPSVGSKYNVVIKSRDFKDIKKIDCKDVYEVYKGKTTIKLSFDPKDNESSVKWSEGKEGTFVVSGYDYEKKETLPNDEAVVYAYALGEFTSTITTSEGVSKTIKFKVVPAPTKISKATAETKSAKKATLKLEWGDTGNFYKIYEKGPKDKKFKLIKTTADPKITLNKKPGKTYSYKIESCYKKGGKVVLSSMGSAVKVMTAPNKAPAFKTLKQKGSTVYVKPYTKSYWHPATRSRAGHYETVKQGNQSNATVTVNYTKVSGAKYIQANKGNPLGYSQGVDTIMYVKNSLSFTYKGKISGKKEQIKIRAIWKNGVCTAYGPWSKTKTVSIKASK